MHSEDSFLEWVPFPKLSQSVWIFSSHRSKTRRPIETKNRNRNASAEHLLAHLKDRYAIVKTYHVHEGENCWTNRYHEKMDRTVMRKDLRPFVMYSMNKRRNWEIDDRVGVELIAEIQKLHKGEDVFLIERVAMETCYWTSVLIVDELETMNSFQTCSVTTLNGWSYESRLFTSWIRMFLEDHLIIWRLSVRFTDSTFHTSWSTTDVITGKIRKPSERRSWKIRLKRIGL